MNKELQYHEYVGLLQYIQGHVYSCYEKTPLDDFMYSAERQHILDSLFNTYQTMALKAKTRYSSEVYKRIQLQYSDELSTLFDVWRNEDSERIEEDMRKEANGK